MAKQLDELSIEQKVQIARAIIALEAAGESLNEIESFYDVDNSVINKIKKAVNERLHEIFEPKQEIASEAPKAKSILERISKGVTSSESTKLTDQDRAELEKGFQIINDYNNQPDEERGLKEKYTVGTDYLIAVTGCKRPIAKAWIEANQSKVDTFNSAVEKYRRDNNLNAERGKKNTASLKDFVKKQSNEKQELAATGGSDSKK
jgi:hypothetical protein